jgi:hypothetical protein
MNGLLANPIFTDAIDIVRPDGTQDGNKLGLISAS